MIDKLILAISPAWALKRQMARHAFELHSGRSQYAGAKTNRLTNPNIPNSIFDINDLVGNSASIIKARVQQLVRDFPHFARAVNMLETYVVGQGILFQSRVSNPDGSLDKKVNQQIEDSFGMWAEKADSSGKLHFYEVQALLKRQDSEAGEFLIIKRYDQKGRYLPFSLEIHEADILDSGMYLSNNGTIEIKQGIEYNIYTGQPIAYHVQDLYGFGKSKRIPAENVVHGFKTLRPNQLRGISPFAPGVMLANDLSDYMDAELDAAKMAAKYLSFVTSPDPLSRQNFGVAVDSDSGNPLETLENAIIEYLRPGEDVRIATNPRPGSNFPPFVKLVLTMASIVTNIPYEILSGDYSGVNYSTLRTSRNDFAQFLKPEAVRHIRHLCNPVYREFLKVAQLTGKLNLPGYAVNPERYYKVEWQPPGMESIDPLKETKAAISQIESNLVSPQQWMKERGRDIETVYAEIAQAKELADYYGLTQHDISTADANNPAAVMEQ